MSEKYVYFFGNGQADGNTTMKNTLGGKGANLAEMTNIGLPVPAGFTITTDVCNYFYAHERQYPPELQAQVDEALAQKADQIESAIEASRAVETMRGLAHRGAVANRGEGSCQTPVLGIFGGLCQRILRLGPGSTCAPMLCGGITDTSRVLPVPTRACYRW